MDYRYFPEPDLLPIILEDEFIKDCRNSLSELPIEKRLRYLNECKLGSDDARILSADLSLGIYFDTVVNITQDPKKSCAYITTVILALMKEKFI
jgi:aspartyl-tRNA(Asn)/glutamyl-tRNA(Gln) amidotransferase subunit B